ncbi:hypothetical protein A0H81_03297 [Grifola frondosa]|uniref:Uncharacterized protein n=1 Tax=Grifola frondosa TaxID=5627 RepID=A0A1C7MGS3_GRIFR|nr:hypothetical protein A0H81_03297 [Grifola frondosa]
MPEPSLTLSSHSRDRNECIVQVWKNVPSAPDFDNETLALHLSRCGAITMWCLDAIQHQKLEPKVQHGQFPQNVDAMSLLLTIVL